MAINLTTPVAVPDVSYQGITKIDLHFPHYMDAGDNNAMKLNKSDLTVVFIVTTWDGGGRVIEETRHSVTFPSWPPAFITDVAAVYSRLENYAISQGFIGAGTGETV